jgi:hypothetical protein
MEALKRRATCELSQFVGRGCLKSVVLTLAIVFLSLVASQGRALSSSPVMGKRHSQGPPDRTIGAETVPPTTALVLKRRFPSSEQEKRDIYFYNAISIAQDEAGHVLMLDSKAKAVLEFQRDGRFVRRFGRGGQGPGEFDYPIRILSRGNSRYVLDSYRIHVFDQAGNFEKTIKTQRAYIDLAAGSSGTFFAAPLLKIGGDRLVDALDGEGNVLFSFAELEKRGGVPAGMLTTVKMVTNDRGEVLLGFQTLGSFHAYDEKGAKLGEYMPQDSGAKKEREYNLGQFVKIAHGERVGYHRIIEALRSAAGLTYVMCVRGHGIEITAFDSDWRVSRTFSYGTGGEFYAIDFEVSGDAASPTFYVLEILPENRIDILAPEKGGIR